MLPSDDGLILAQGSHRLRIQVQVGLHQFGWRQRHPLAQRYIREAGGSEHLQEAQRLVARVFDVACHRERDGATSPACGVKADALAAHETFLVNPWKRKAQAREERSRLRKKLLRAPGRGK